MIDEAIGAARRKQHFYKLILMPGVHTPNWVYKQERRFETLGSHPHRTATYRNRMRPLPWDRVYLRAFEFIAAAGQRYAADPFVQGSGRHRRNFQSARAHLPKSSEGDQQRWEELHYRENLPKA